MASEGLDALLGLTGEQLGSGPGGGAGRLVQAPVGSIEANEFQPRQHFDEDELATLASSIAVVGVLQPLLVRRIDEHRYELIAGERRLRAARRAGLVTVPVLVREVDDQRSLEQAVVENVHRSDLNVLEEAAAYRQLMEEFGLTQDEVAHRVGKSRSAIANTVRLFQLPVQVQRLVAAGALSAGHGRALLAFPAADVQVRIALRIVEEELSVREVERLVRAASQRDGDGREDGRRTVDRPAALLEMESVLADRLDTRVTATMSGGRGRLVVEFADLDDLDRIYRILGR